MMDDTNVIRLIKYRIPYLPFNLEGVMPGEINRIKSELSVLCERA